MMLQPVCVGRCLFPRSAGPVLAWRRWTIVYAAVSIPFKGFTRHWGLRDCTTLISFVSEPRKGSTLNTHCTNKPYRIEWRWGLSETLHLPQLFSTNMAVCAPPASQIQGTFPRFKGSPAFFHLCAPAHGQNHRLIFQNMFLACTPTPPSSHLPASLYTSPPSFASVMPPPPPNLHPPTPPASSLTHAAHSLFTTYSPLAPAPTPTCLPPRLLARQNVWYFSISQVLLLHCSLQSNHQCSMFYGLIRNDLGRSSQGSWGAKSRRMKWWNRGGEGQGAVCSRILMSTKGNIQFFFFF